MKFILSGSIRVIPEWLGRIFPAAPPPATQSHQEILWEDVQTYFATENGRLTKNDPLPYQGSWLARAHIYGYQKGTGTIKAIIEWEDEQGKTYRFEHDLAEVTVTE